MPKQTSTHTPFNCRTCCLQSSNLFRNTTTTAVLRPLHRSTCVSRHLQLRAEDFVGAQFYCPHALADGNQCIPIREKTLEFSTVLSTLSPYRLEKRHNSTTHTHQFLRIPGLAVALQSSTSCSESKPIGIKVVFFQNSWWYEGGFFQTGCHSRHAPNTNLS